MLHGSLLLWMSVHRIAIIGVLAASIWITGYVWYISTDVRQHIKLGKAHRWEANMELKKGRRGA